MPQFIIRTVNSTFDAADCGYEYVDVAAAYRAAIKAGISIATDEVLDGSPQAMVEVGVEELDGTPRARGIVAISTSALIIP